ncbi:hypothetical protein ACR82Z_03445 [Mycoplasma sp. 6243]|uniref:hypothetical protein n=1 Tax=Mycoplasma sp. 6243 TaxID=3440865 RepID=UPI003EBF4D75
MKHKKKIWAFSAATLSLVPVAAAVSCGSGEKAKATESSKKNDLINAILTETKKTYNFIESKETEAKTEMQNKLKDVADDVVADTLAFYQETMQFDKNAPDYTAKYAAADAKYPKSNATLLEQLQNIAKGKGTAKSSEPQN